MFRQSTGQTSNSRLETIIADLKERRINTVDLSKIVLTQLQLSQLLNAIKQNEEKTDPESVVKCEKVYLNECSIGDIGANMIAAFLAGNKTITELHLDGNQITANGFADMTDALISPAQLKENAREYAIIYPEIDTLKTENDKVTTPPFNSSLQSLHLENNQLNDGCIDDLRRLMLGTNSLTSLSIVGNPMNDQTKFEVEEMRKLNSSISNITAQSTHESRLSVKVSPRR